MPNFSVVELPADMPAEVQKQLKQTRIRNQPLELKVDPRGGVGVGGREERGGRRDGGAGRPRREGGASRGRGGEGHRGQRDGGSRGSSRSGSRD